MEKRRAAGEVVSGRWSVVSGDFLGDETDDEMKDENGIGGCGREG
jgi:hypothetical protein